MLSYIIQENMTQQENTFLLEIFAANRHCVLLLKQDRLDY